jgi:cytochrome P450
MAYHEMRLIMAKVLHSFDLKLCAESKGWMKEQQAYTLWQKPPLMVEIRARAEEI